MIYLLLAAALVLGSIADEACVNVEPAGGQCDEAGCVPDESGENCVPEEEEFQGPGITTETPDCDDTANLWAVDYIGQSTQFRLYDPCEDNKFIKIKMVSLTEMDGDKKTNRKITSFASTGGDWDNTDNPDSDVYGDYNGNTAIINKFKADAIDMKDFVFDFELTTYFFTTDEDTDSDPQTDTVSRNNMKFSVNIVGWPLDKDENTLELCINVMTNKGSADNDGDDTYYLGEFAIENDDQATCTDDQDNESVLGVDIAQDGNGGGNQLDLCYTFSSCDGDVFYDPIIRYEGAATSLSVIFSFGFVILISLL